MLTKDEAICIRALDYSETSQIVTFFTRATGKISAIAKGSKRPKSAFDGPIELFSYGNIVFSDATREKLATLTEFEQRPALSRLPRDLFRFNCCLFAAELLNNLTDDYDPHPELFDGVLSFLQNTNEVQDTVHASRDALALLLLFQLTLLKEVGLQPVLNACANCKTTHEACTERGRRMRDARCELYFSSSANGLICRDCEASFPDKIKLSGSAAQCLTGLKFLAAADKETLNEIQTILTNHFTELLHRPPKMAKYILKG
ncbi:MAG: DNA repair protein RecO [Planctomycetota bacterium]|jgi:DNA repair protein RecO (recombination protein O)